MIDRKNLSGWLTAALVVVAVFVTPTALSGCSASTEARETSAAQENSRGSAEAAVGLEVEPTATASESISAATRRPVEPTEQFSEGANNPEAVDVEPAISIAPTSAAVQATPDPSRQEQNGGETHQAEQPSEIDETSAETAADIVFDFITTYIETRYGGSSPPGWVQSGDMDGDRDIDIIAGGGYALYIYENDGNGAGWKRYGNLDGTAGIGANGGEVFDVDDDGDLDVVSAQYYGDMGWWENPGGQLSSEPWPFHPLRNGTRYLHDIILTDLDQDGVDGELVATLNSSYWDTDIELIWLRPGIDPKGFWEVNIIEAGRSQSSHGHTGIDLGDVDGDGHLDLAFSNGWYEAPDNLKGQWTWRQISNIYGLSNSLARDMDGDGDLDLVVTGGHHGQGAFWFENSGNPQDSASWVQHNISAVVGDLSQRHYYGENVDDHLHHPECLGVEDLDSDGDLDVVTCDLFFGEDPGEPAWSDEIHNVYIYENLGKSASWQKHNVAPNTYPSHGLKLSDIDGDGRTDVIGNGGPSYYLNYFRNVTELQTVPAPTAEPPLTPAPTPTSGRHGGSFYVPFISTE